ncbi:MAG TPA: TetR/AcrR family transcriptional regulator [Acidimicrobiales bacterium]
MTMSGTATRWQRYGAGNGANRDVYEAILRAAADCFAIRGLRRTSMDDVAGAAGVSRATVYNYVNNKEMLVADLVAREARRINDEARGQLDLTLPSTELIAEAELAILDGAIKSPLAEVFTSVDVVDLTADAIGHSPSFADVQHGYWSAVFDIIRDRGELRDGLDEDEAINWLTSISFLLTTGPTTFEHDKEVQRRYLVNYVAPAFVACATDTASD